MSEHVQHGLLPEGRDGAGDECPGREVAGDGQEDNLMAGSGYWASATGICGRGGRPRRPSVPALELWFLVAATAPAGLICSLLAGLFHPFLDGAVVEVQLHHRRFGWLQADDHHAHASARGTRIDQRGLAVGGAFGSYPYERMPIGPKGTLDYTAHIDNIGGGFESFKDSEFQASNTGGAGEEQGHTKQWDVRVMHAVGALDGADDTAELMIARRGRRGRTQHQDKSNCRQGFHFGLPFSDLAMDFMVDFGKVFGFSLGMPNSPPRSASSSTSIGPTILTTVSSFASAAMITMPAIRSSSSLKKTSTLSPSRWLRTPTALDHGGEENWARSCSTSAEV